MQLIDPRQSYLDKQYELLLQAIRKVEIKWVDELIENIREDSSVPFSIPTFMAQSAVGILNFFHAFMSWIPENHKDYLDYEDMDLHYHFHISLDGHNFVKFMGRVHTEYKNLSKKHNLHILEQQYKNFLEEREDDE